MHIYFLANAFRICKAFLEFKEFVTLITTFSYKIFTFHMGQETDLSLLCTSTVLDCFGFEINWVWQLLDFNMESAD